MILIIDCFKSAFNTGGPPLTAKITSVVTYFLCFGLYPRKLGIFALVGGPPTVPLISRNVDFLKFQNPRNAGTL